MLVFVLFGVSFGIRDVMYLSLGATQVKIGVIGNGIVGSATARSFIEHVDEVRVYDKVPTKRVNPLLETLACDLVFICLPTPQDKPNLRCDTSILDEFFEAMREDYRETNFVLRSTVPIGYTKSIAEKYGFKSLIHSPEFLTARCAFTDAQMPARNILGYVANSMSYVLTDCEKQLQSLLKKRFPSVPIHKMTSDESESVKLMLNSFFAVKVSFFNEMYELCRKLGLDWERVLNGILSDGRIAYSHTKVPGPDGKLGYGGTCLPKDIASLIDTFDKNALKSPVLLSSHIRNQYDRDTIND